MPATHPRISAVVEPELAHWLRRRADAQGCSLSLLVRDILAEHYVREEERLWVAAGEERLRSFDREKALSHEEAWA